MGHIKPKTLLDKVYSELKYLEKVKTQEDFGLKMGYTKNYTSAFMNRKGLPHSKLLNNIHKVYGISLTWLRSDGKCGTDMWGKPLSDNIEKLNNQNNTKFNETNISVESKKIDNNSLTSSAEQNGETSDMVYSLIAAQRDFAVAAKDQAVAAKDTAAAILNISRSNTLLTEMIYNSRTSSYEQGKARQG